jgi:hypothetical protein
MKRLNVQIQPALSPAMDEAGAVTRLRSLAVGARITEGDDEGCYVNIGYSATDLANLWRAVHRELESVAGLAAATIIVCEGEHGWADYLLLHHYDPSEPLDTLP